MDAMEGSSKFAYNRPPTRATASASPESRTRPMSAAFPARPGSAASSASGQLVDEGGGRSSPSGSTDDGGRLRHKTSSRSLRSLVSNASARDRAHTSGSTKSSTSRRVPPPVDVRSDSSNRASVALDDDLTPSMAQGEWAFASRVSSRSLQRDGSLLVPTMQPMQPRPSSPSSASIATTSSSTSGGPSSPARLMPRSPMSDRDPLDDFHFLKQMGITDDHPSMHLTRKRTDSPVPSTGNHPDSPSTPSSLRSERLREEIQRTAERYRWLGVSSERVGADGTANLGSAATGGRDLGSTSSLPLYPGAPPPLLGSSSGGRRMSSDTQNSPSLGASSNSVSHVRSSSTDMPASLRGVFHTSPFISASASAAARPTPSSASAFAGRTNLDNTSSSITPNGMPSLPTTKSSNPKPRPRELREWNQVCLFWQREKASSGVSTVAGVFNKANKFGDVPAAMKRKITKRDSSQLLSPAEAVMFGYDDRSKDRDRDKEKEKKEKDREKEKIRSFANGVDVGKKDGSWKKVTALLKEDGTFRILGEDKTVIRTVNLGTTPRSDVRLVDPSLFGASNCVSIRMQSTLTPFPPSPSGMSHSSSSLGLGLLSSSSSFSSSRLGGTNMSADAETLYLRMPSIVATQIWFGMAHCCAMPDVVQGNTLDSTYGSCGGLGIEEGVAGGNMGSEVDGAGDRNEGGFRVFRSLSLTICEGRSIGEPGTEKLRATPGIEHDTSLSEMFSGSESTTSPIKGSASSTASSIQRIPGRTGQGWHESNKDADSSPDTYCEIIINDEVMAKTTLRKGTASPFWNETFTFEHLAGFVEPITIRVFQTHKHSKTSLVGIATVRIANLPRGESIENWWCLKPISSDSRTRSYDTVGELSLSIRVGEEVILPSSGYGEILNLLKEDEAAELVTDIASEFPTELEEIAKIMLNIYISQDLLLPRIFKLADLEVEKGAQSAAILFRGNSILTKVIEMYMRKIGVDYLEASIGEPIRKLYGDKVEIEIDPSRLKPGTKEKEIQANINELLQWAMTTWNSIYEARERCPQDLRQIFSHIQKIVGERYGEDHKNTRWTSVSAFIFLRFFVPAILNPRLFGLVSAAPDPKSQRTLTLVAKTLQGLANFSSFGQKEPWMLPVNTFVQDNTSAFVDFIEHISRHSALDPAVAKQEWTSAAASVYATPNDLRDALSPLARDGVPTLPHLIDLPRNLGLLASNVNRIIIEKAHSPGGENGKSAAPSVASRGPVRSPGFSTFIEACADVCDAARRRGTGKIWPIQGMLPIVKPDFQTRAQPTIVQVAAAAAPSSFVSAPFAHDSGPRPSTNRIERSQTLSSTPPPRSNSNGATRSLSGAEAEDADGPAEIHIRAKTKPLVHSPSGSIASRRSTRSNTFSGESPRAGMTAGTVFNAHDGYTAAELSFARSHGIVVADSPFADVPSRTNEKSPRLDSAENDVFGGPQSSRGPPVTFARRHRHSSSVEGGSMPPHAELDEREPPPPSASTSFAGFVPIEDYEDSSRAMADDILDSYAFPARTPLAAVFPTAGEESNHALTESATLSIRAVETSSLDHTPTSASSSSPSVTSEHPVDDTSSLFSVGAANERGGEMTPQMRRGSMQYSSSSKDSSSSPFSFGKSVPMAQSLSAHSNASTTSDTSNVSDSKGSSAGRRGSLNLDKVIGESRAGQRRKKGLWGLGASLSSSSRSSKSSTAS
ncbi:BZ3500_MvSof-1268-A1-R1_Chr2-1g04651 [Microbotryum saponariae]|uniref:BZ3500_MvSof-1268-A1-R1_Chr2-1g04651 protein n=1 Tax=Microbotryum saponariae TaxID=289078 RepID=A0A2X0KRL2_9BASI|nr:BZ3500_MvSof-1268-A1-R1_Chr2-1g04651 [Microbotryum saponariae]SCZ92219.1 BZ3501_MvSof-1269-A2-R1_Chr2-1g04307 [Microbotryum saponariae]